MTKYAHCCFGGEVGHDLNARCALVAECLVEEILWVLYSSSRVPWPPYLTNHLYAAMVVLVRLESMCLFVALAELNKFLLIGRRETGGGRENAGHERPQLRRGRDLFRFSLHVIISYNV